MNLRRGRTSQGGSTITQQLARNLFLTHERTITRKIKETLLTIRLERIYSKDEILAMYFNQIYYGHGAYGAKAATREYFDKRARRSRAWGSAHFSPACRRTPRCSIRAAARRTRSGRRNRGARRMMRRLRARSRPRRLRRRANTEEVVLAERTRAARCEPRTSSSTCASSSSKEYGADRLYGEGLQVDDDARLERIQEVAERALEEQLARLENASTSTRWFATPRGSLPSRPSSHHPTCRAPASSSTRTTGEILAMVGGRNYWESKFNRAVQARRQPGKRVQAVRLHRRHRAGAGAVDDHPG